MTAGTDTDAGAEADTRADEDVKALAEAREEEPETERVTAKSSKSEDVPRERSPGTEGRVLSPVVNVSF